MGIFAGVIYFFRALGLLLTNPSLIALALIPSLVTLGLSLFSLWLCGTYGAELIRDGLLSAGVELDPASWGAWIVEKGAWFLSGLLSVFITPWLVVLFGFPLCEPLSARADSILGGREVEVSFLKSILTGLKVSILVALIGITGSLFLLFLGLVPVLGLFTAPLSFFVWTPFVLCFDLCDAKFARLQLSFGERFGKLRQHFFSAISVGFVASLLIMPPFFNLLGLPVAVLMGTILAREIEIRDLTPSQNYPPQNYPPQNYPPQNRPPQNHPPRFTPPQQ